MNSLYTIGHSQHQLDKFIAYLKTYNINYILDVRSTPYSKHAPQYNKEYISHYLELNSINYAFMGNYFGARLDDISLYTNDGYLDFEKVARTDIFIKGINNTILGLERGNNICFMCTETKPIDCHRTILVARAFYERGFTVEHILNNNTIKNHTDIEEDLLKMYYPDRGQLSLFHHEIDEKEYIKLSYRRRNKEIGYHIDSNIKQVM